MSSSAIAPVGRIGAGLLPASRYADVVVVAPQDRLDHANGDAFSLALEPYLADCRPGGIHLVLDLSALRYVSSAGLRCFMLAAKQAKAQGGEVVIAGMQAVVREIFEISRFTLLFKVFDDVSAALEALSPRAAQVHRGR
ncbi:MAG: STAS domain-containing protein [Burkholderiales bacterium]|nr:STAS domain-containing protein [Burkholderiales bacterium]